ncbi:MULTISPECIES: hypothetical protein [unclassified Streptomyces]|uniref:hypothetical protein n=1 Tax=unclassified Streptomyces TaxID=2593676 RepID=UPI0036E1A83F
MPGQRKRKRQRQQGREWAAARFSPEAGHWEVLFETHDQSEFRARIQRLRTENRQLDDTSLRLDTLCGRLTHPTTYRLSLFAPAAAPVAADDDDHH